MQITEFQLNPRIEHDHGIMALEVWMLGDLGAYRGKLLLPITWEQIDAETGEPTADTLEMIEMIVRRLNANETIRQAVEREPVRDWDGVDIY